MTPRGDGDDTALGFDADPTDGQDRIFAPSASYSAASIGSAITITAAGADTLVRFVSGPLAGETLLLLGVT